MGRRLIGRRSWAPVALAGLLVGCATPAEQPSADAGSGTEGGIRTVSVDGQERTYRLHLPAESDEPAPLVLLFHGLGGDAAGIEGFSGWPEVAQANGAVLASPEGIGRSFDGGGCCGPAAEDEVDDVAAALAVIDDVAQTTPIDPARIYATGYSNGGHMSYRLACETDRFAAIAPVAGGRLVSCDSPDAALLHVHGTVDTSVPAAGEERPGGVVVPPAQDVVDAWRDALQCEIPTQERTGNARRTSASCAQGRSADLVLLEGVGHTWPRSAEGFDTTEMSWAFFAEHHR